MMARAGTMSASDLALAMYHWASQSVQMNQGLPGQVVRSGSA